MLKTMTVRTTIAAILAGLSMSAHAMADAARPINVPAGDLVTALESLAKQADIELVYQAEQLKGIHTDGVSGNYEPKDAVSLLLKGTQLTIRTDKASGVMLVGPAKATPPLSFNSSAGADEAGTATARERPRSFWSRLRLAQSDSPSPAQGDGQAEVSGQGATKAATSAQASQKTAVQLDEVTVVGTRIKGARPSSPVITITRDEMRLSGQNTLGDVIRSLPQNFGGGQNPGVAAGATTGGLANQNITGGSTLNLRGLGPDATLTLLNGARLPYDGYIQATDVAVIPVAAIERVEVLLDGASAIYGSDAVGGVANIVLKRDYQGAELSARYGEATDGGYGQQQYTGVFGQQWESGGFLITGDYSQTKPIWARQRDYLDYLPNPDTTIYPGSTQRGGLLSGHQKIGDFTELALDAFYTHRGQSFFVQISPSSRSSEAPTTDIWGVAPSVRFELPRDWTLAVDGFAGHNENKAYESTFSTGTGALTSVTRNCYCNKSTAAGVEAEGALLSLPAGEMRLSIGGGYRRNEYETRLNGVVRTEGSDHSYSAYGEVNVPLVSSAQGIPLVAGLSFNGALRHENYASFGGTTTPKLGVLWSVTPAFDLKATWGRSFKVPTLTQQFQDQRLFLYPGSLFQGAPAGTDLLVTSGGNQGLGPERAEIVTAGFTARPAFLPRLTLDFGWFDIDYTNRVVLPITPVLQALTNPAFANFVTRNPDSAAQNSAFAWAGLPAGVFVEPSESLTGAPYNPANVYALLYDSYANAAVQRTRGVDLAATYTTPLSGGDLSANGNASWITDSTRSLTALAPELMAAGVAFTPAKFRARVGANWSRDGVTLASYVNHIRESPTRSSHPMSKVTR
ncbi:MAG: TonB-dependent receptor [Gammaproteobacteria bacterium]